MSSWWPDGAGGNGGFMSVFNVKLYGAKGNGSTDDSDAFTAALAALHTAGGGVLYCPSPDSVYVTQGGYTIDVPFLVIGDGSAAFANRQGAGSTQCLSKIVCDSATAALFTTTCAVGKFRDIALECGASSTPSAGAGIHVTGSLGSERIDYDNVYIDGFYDNLTIDTGAGWTMCSFHSVAPVRYGARIQNVNNQDEGDWAISDSDFYSSKYDSTAGIRIEGAGGGKIVNCKVNSYASSHLFTDAISIAFASGEGSGLYLLANNSLENFSGNGVHVTVDATSSLSTLILNGNEIAGLGVNTNPAVNVNVASGGSANGLLFVNNVLRGDPSASGAFSFTNVGQALVGKNSLSGFTTLYTQSGSTITDASGSIGSSVAVTGATSAGSSNASPSIPVGNGSAGAAWTQLVHAKKTITGVNLNQDITVTGTTFADLDSSLDITLTTGARRCRIGWLLTGKVADTTHSLAVDVTVDGAQQGRSYGLSSSGGGAANQGVPLNGETTTDFLSAGSHTFKLVVRVDGGTGTVLNSIIPVQFTVDELL